MNRVSIALSVLFVPTLFVLTTVPALAQGPFARQSASEGGTSPGEVRATPEMWFYEQYQREYLDPKMAVRRNAEQRAAQRRQRMAALKWFGFSNQRPQAGPEPFHGEWSPVWTSNNGAYPYRWGGSGWPGMVGRPSVVWSRGGSFVASY